MIQTGEKTDLFNKTTTSTPEFLKTEKRTAKENGMAASVPPGTPLADARGSETLDSEPRPLGSGCQIQAGDHTRPCNWGACFSRKTSREQEGRGCGYDSKV